MDMSKFIVIDKFEHFTFAFADETFLFGIFRFLRFAKVAFPRGSGIETGIVAMFVDLGLTEGA